MAGRAGSTAKHDEPDERLRTYRAKRRFDRTREPRGTAAPRRSAALQFVVQEHHARRLHYDFRLELDGVLLSWSIPKGPSLNPRERRLAVRTEDHPIAYRDFEGVIPKGEYGGGSVLVWDRGAWIPDGDPRTGLERGRLTFTLQGEKLRGRFHLVRTKGERGNEWLMFKGRDELARDTGNIIDERPGSVLSGRSIEQVTADRDRVWHSNRSERADAHPAPGRPAPGIETPQLEHLVAALPKDAPLTNLDKVLYPDANVTKAMVIAYMAVTAEWSLPHVARRPLMLLRCPNGQGKQCFHQKHAVQGTPAALHRVKVPEDDGSIGIYLTVADLKGMIAIAQLGALEVHTWGAQADKPEKPDLLVFDLDPDPSVRWNAVVDAAFEMRRVLERAGLESWVKTTGGKGLHVVAPIQRRGGWDETKAFTRSLAEQLAHDAPHRYTTNPLKARRAGRIFIDYVRNSRGATFIAPYSPRARPGAPVATPISWDELSAGVDPASFTILTIPRRLASLERDPWHDLLAVRQSITAHPARARRSR
ncbi:MAG: non-homologous end-joining DNA ligase [Kofleriaceae bacterium]